MKRVYCSQQFSVQYVIILWLVASSQVQNGVTIIDADTNKNSSYFPLLVRTNMSQNQETPA
jgi:hypothetical protein